MSAIPVAEEGRALFQTTFNPEQFFAGDIAKDSDDQLIMTVATSKRDDYLPDYSLAIAYRCDPIGDNKCQPNYIARMLRVRPSEGLSNISYDPEHLEWLEASLWDCEGGISAMESVRKSDWHPDIHYMLLGREDRDLIFHPAMIRIKMVGTYTTTSYEGWVLAQGAPAAVHEMVSILDRCWRPSESLPPWRH